MAFKFVSVDETLSLVLTRLKPALLKINGRLDALEACKISAVAGTVISNASQTSGSAFAAGSFTLTKGEYLVTLTGRWSANANGYRQLWVSSTSTGSALDWASVVSAPATNGAITSVQLTVLLQVTAASTTFYAVAQQNSSSSLTLNVRKSVVKIA